jgi:hypothetical protein
MPIPPSATVQAQSMDPRDIRDYRFNLDTSILEPGEEIDDGHADTELVLGAEAVAAGLTLLTTGGYATEVGPDYLVIWVSIDPSLQADPMFDGGGVSLPMEFTFRTTSTPSRRKQKTLVIKAANQ